MADSFFYIRQMFLQNDVDRNFDYTILSIDQFEPLRVILIHGNVDLKYHSDEKCSGYLTINDNRRNS